MYLCCFLFVSGIIFVSITVIFTAFAWYVSVDDVCCLFLCSYNCLGSSTCFYSILTITTRFVLVMMLLILSFSLLSYHPFFSCSYLSSYLHLFTSPLCCHKNLSIEPQLHPLLPVHRCDGQCGRWCWQGAREPRLPTMCSPASQHVSALPSSPSPSFYLGSGAALQCTGKEKIQTGLI